MMWGSTGPNICHIGNGRGFLLGDIYIDKDILRTIPN